MSHLRAKFQQTSGQRLYASHHFPARFQNILARQTGTAGDHLMSQKKCFNPVCTARPTFLLPRPPLPASRLSHSSSGARNISESELSKRTGIFCRRSLVSAAALPLHLPSKAEHLGQGGLLLTDVHFRSVSSHFSLACGSQVSCSRGCGRESSRPLAWGTGGPS